MNVPAPAPVTLENLANVASAEALTPSKHVRTKSRRARTNPDAVPATSLFMSAAGVLAWRLAPTVISSLIERAGFQVERHKLTMRDLKTARRAARRAALSLRPLIALLPALPLLPSQKAARRRRNLLIAGGVGALALTLLTRWQLQRIFTQEPAHIVELKRGPFEIRRYPEIRIATTTVDDIGWEDALSRGFRRLASFIFGENDKHKRLAMKSPVFGTGDDNGYRLSFVLPEGDLPPRPNDERVEVSMLPARRVAVLRYHGRYNARAIEDHKLELLRALLHEGLTPKGVVSFAGYDPPSTLPLLRRNELWVEIA